MCVLYTINCTYISHYIISHDFPIVYPANVFKTGYRVESGELLLFQEKLRAREQRVCEREQDLVTREKRVADREVR